MLNENWLALAFPSHIVKIKSLSISFLIRPGMKKSRYFKSLPPFPIVPSYSKRLKFLKKYSTLGAVFRWEKMLTEAFLWCKERYSIVQICKHD